VGHGYSMWATKWSVENDLGTGSLTVSWDDETGSHWAEIQPPGSGLVPCEARLVTEAGLDLICGRVETHEGAHVSIDHWRRLGSVAN